MNCWHDRWRVLRSTRSTLRGALVGVLTGVVPVAGRAQQPALSASAPALVFEGVTVVDVERGKLLPDRRVVVEGRHIRAVGDPSAVPMPPESQVVEARGKYLIPGLWDLHVHLVGDQSGFSYPLLVATGVTGIRDAYAGLSWILDSTVQKWREILAGTRVGPPRQLLAGPVLRSDL